mgnify:CR=1 FL=1
MLCVDGQLGEADRAYVAMFVHRKGVCIHLRKTALIAGASGLVGSELLQILLKKEVYDRVIAIVRRSLGIKHPKLVEAVCDFDRLDEMEGSLFEVDDVFCCLGTTIKKAKSKPAMYKIDVEYPLTIARLACEQGARHYLLISAMNANSKSPFFYPKIKGILEEKVQVEPYEAISIFRPSLLLGDRKEFRFGENLAIKMFRAISPLLKDSWKSGMAIEAIAVAQAMYNAAQLSGNGTAIYDARAIETLAKHS